MIHDYCVVGGGIVGLAAALKLLERRPGASLVLLEKEDGVAAHQTGHNSGVIHSGIYYAPGSFKATLCREGAEATKAFCAAQGIPFEVCGKLLVATNALEVERMDALHERCKVNKVEVERLDRTELKRREPNIEGLGALFVPSTGIVDYRRVSEAMAEGIRRAGGEIVLGAAVDRIVEEADAAEIGAGARSWRAKRLVVCGGLQSDRLARLAGMKIDYRIVPFRGEYFALPSRLNGIVRHLIYPIPDPDLPFLGIHLTRMIDGGVTVGPNAVLGFAREGYGKFSVDLGDTLSAVSYPGFWRTVFRNRKSAASELRNSLWKAGYLRECQKYCPDLKLGDLLPYRPGIRAQAVAPDGTLIHDFLFRETARMLHVCNAPSPAATSALPIGALIAEKCLSAAP